MTIDFLGPRIGLALVLLFAAGFSLVAAWLWWRGLRVLGWPTVTGRILEIEIKSIKDSENTPYYQVDMVYEYEVNGKRYTGSKWYLDSLKTYASEKKAVEFREKYKAGDEIQVRYHPKVAGESVLFPFQTPGLLLAAFICFLFFLFGLAKWRAL